MIPYGVHFNMPAETYHALPGASASKLKAFHRTTPAHARVRLEEPFEQTPYTLMGTLVHGWSLEGKLPRLAVQPDEYAPGKKWNHNANECKRWRSEQNDAGKIIIKKDEMRRVQGMVNALFNHEEVYGMIVRSQCEVSVITHDQTNNVPFRCRKDIVPGPKETLKTPEGYVKGFLADIKAFSDVTDRALERDSYDRGLHIQAATYLAVWNSQCGAEDRRDEFVFIFVENEAPFSVRPFRCSDRFLEKGREDMARYLKLYAECTRTGIWPGYPSECQTLDLPGYVRDGE